MSTSYVVTESIEPGIAIIRITREKALNALNSAVLDELENALDQAEHDESLRVVIVTGEGEKAFVAGADIDAIHQISDRIEGGQFAERGQTLFARFGQSPLIFIAAIHGYALGGGLELAMALDFRLASNRARLGQPEINLGIIPGFGGTQRLSRLIGEGRALWMICSGEPVNAEEARVMGLIDTVVAADGLMDEALRRARILAQKAPLALRACKRMVRQSRDWSLEQGLHQEALAFADVAVSEDGREGTRAFLEKRSPVFRGR